MESGQWSSDSVGQHECSAASRGVGRGLPDLPDMKHNHVMSRHMSRYNMSCHVMSPHLMVLMSWLVAAPHTG